MRLSAIHAKTGAYRDYCDALAAACKSHDIRLEVIGHIHQYDIHKIVINDSKDKTICVSSGIHGDEKAGPHAILEFLKGDIPDDVRLVIYPVINPRGFQRNSRTNYKGRDINRGFGLKNKWGENRIIYDDIVSEDIDFFYSLHEDDGDHDFYLYYSDVAKESLYRRLLRVASDYFPISEFTKIYGAVVDRGLIDIHGENKTSRTTGTLEYLMFDNDINYVCVETPGREDLERRIACQVAVWRYFLEHVTEFVL